MPLQWGPGMCPRVIVMWSRSYVGHPFMLTADCWTAPVTHHITISTLIGPPGISPATRSSHHPMRHAGVTGLHNVPPSSTWQTAYQIYPRSSNETPLHPFLCFAKMHDGTITRENDRGKISIHLFDSATFFPPVRDSHPLCSHWTTIPGYTYPGDRNMCGLKMDIGCVFEDTSAQTQFRMSKR